METNSLRAPEGHPDTSNSEIGMAAAAAAATAMAGSLTNGLRFPLPKRIRIMSLTPTRRTLATAAAPAPGSEPPAPAPPKPWLLVGLGNPGKLYQGTRHNVGFEMVDAIAEAEGISVNSIKFKAMLGKGYIGDFPIMLAKPQTFMNVSGGHGGHNGMRSVISRLKGSRDFPRLRIGIGRPAGKMDPANFVLRPFSKKEREELDYAFQKGVEAVRILLTEGFNKSATFVNTPSKQLLNT